MVVQLEEIIRILHLVEPYRLITDSRRPPRFLNYSKTTQLDRLLLELISLGELTNVQKPNSCFQINPLLGAITITLNKTLLIYNSRSNQNSTVPN